MLYFPVYALYHYFPEIAWIRTLLTAVLLFGGISGILILHKKRKIVKRHPGWWIALWVYTIFILYITVLGRYSFEDFRARLIPFESYREVFAGSSSELRGIVLNVVLFVPFGFLTACCFLDKKPVWIALCAGLILTVSVEVLQYLTRTGTLETDDVMHNMLGTVLGIAIWSLINRLIKKRCT